MARTRDILTKPLYRLYEARLVADLDKGKLPRHIGVILDGHRRYARVEGLPDYRASYRVGTDKLIEFIHWTRELDVPAVTCWLLSKENLGRDTGELDTLFEVFVELFERMPSAIGDHDVSVRFIGSLDLVPRDVAAAAKRLEEECSGGKRRITLALGYGGRQEIVDATRDLVTKLAAEGIAADAIADHIDADTLAKHMYTADLPDPDLVIRTSGEARLSGFLLWQSAYAEYSFVDVFWPQFRRVDFLRALRDFTRRERRFGR
ncbi:MAG TPA: polyprenyl diphosphate synthase [Acidimicrobiia bacterium]|jgi:short-chain Z-isoprenyl diphosphate synthase